MVTDRIWTNITLSINYILVIFRLSLVEKVLNKPKSNAYGLIWPLTLVYQILPIFNIILKGIPDVM